jgi:hypothetical protein
MIVGQLNVSTSYASPSTNRKQILHCMFTEIECWPTRSSSSLCSRLLGGIFKSSAQTAESRYCNLRKAPRQISAGNRFALPASYSCAVCRSANVLITQESVNYRVTHVQSLPEYRHLLWVVDRARCQYSTHHDKTEVTRPSSAETTCLHDAATKRALFIVCHSSVYQTGLTICTAASCSIRPNADTLPAFSFRTIRSICTIAPRCHASNAAF